MKVLKVLKKISFWEHAEEQGVERPRQRQQGVRMRKRTSGVGGRERASEELAGDQGE